MIVRQSDNKGRSRQVKKLDLSQPLPPEPRLNLAALVEIPLTVIDHAIFPLLAERGHPELRPAHSKVFTVIKGSGSRVTEMAAEAAMTKQSMQYLIDDLERLGYTERIPDLQDRRAKLVRLTPRGRSEVLVARESISATESAWGRQLGKAKMRQLRALLEELVSKLVQREGNG